MDPINKMLGHMVALKNFLDTMAEMDNYQSIVAQQRSNLGHALGRVNSLTPEDATKLVQALNDLPLPRNEKIQNVWCRY